MMNGGNISSPCPLSLRAKKESRTKTRRTQRRFSFLLAHPNLSIMRPSPFREEYHVNTYRPARCRRTGTLRRRTATENNGILRTRDTKRSRQRTADSGYAGVLGETKRRNRAGFSCKKTRRIRMKRHLVILPLARFDLYEIGL